MKFLADESVDRQIVEGLRQSGHDVSYVSERAPGLADDAVLELANREQLVLVTADKDFGDLVFRQRRGMPGVVLIRLAGLAEERKAELVASVIRERESELAGAFAVITPAAIRIRRPVP